MEFFAPCVCGKMSICMPRSAVFVAVPCGHRTFEVASNQGKKWSVVVTLVGDVMLVLNAYEPRPAPSSCDIDTIS